jgi:hypothetical protein
MGRPYESLSHPIKQARGGFRPDANRQFQFREYSDLQGGVNNSSTLSGGHVLASWRVLSGSTGL